MLSHTLYLNLPICCLNFQAMLRRFSPDMKTEVCICFHTAISLANSREKKRCLWDPAFHNEY